jgi:GT2 family glycosyltransferase
MCLESNRGFGAACNSGLAMVRTPRVLLLNPDARLGEGSLREMGAMLSSDPRLAAVQPVIRAWGWPEVTASRGIGITPCYEGYDLGFMRFEPFPADSAVLTGVSAAASLWRADALKALGGFDPGFFMYFEDVDLCIRAAALGWRFALAGRASCEHMTGATSSRGRAERWEHRSALRLAALHSGRGGRLPGPVLRREARMLLSGLAKGRPVLWRLSHLLAAVSDPPEPGCRFIPPAAPPGEPGGARPLPPFPLDAGGRLIAGPGWISEQGGSMRGYGAVRSSAPGGFCARVSSSALPRTLRIWSGAEAGPTVVASTPDPVRLETLSSGRTYIACDDGETIMTLASAEPRP